MNTDKSQIDNLLNSLRERAKELNCLYQVEELLKDYSVNLETIFQEAIKVIPLGWRYSNYCMVRIEYKGKIYQTPNYIETNLLQSAYIAVQDIKIGSIKVSYTEEFPEDENNAFLSEENKLIISIANRLGDFILHQQLRRVNRKIKKVKSERKTDSALEWRIAIDLSRRTDSELFVRITRKMINYLVWNGVEETKEILQRIGSVDSTTLQELKDGENRPHQWTQTVSILTVAKEIYDIASENLPDEEIFACIQKWMMEDRASFLIKTLVNLNSTLGDITDAIRRFVQLSSEGIKLSEYSLKGVRVSLIRRIVTDNLEYIKIAKSFVEVSDFQDILKRMIYPMGSHGQLGGKSAGLFIAWQIIKKYQDQYPILKEVKIPKTWYITSDGFHNFMDHNDLEEVTEQKYKDLNQVRQEYQHIINLFKSSQFTPEITKGLSMALDDFGDKPIIVRSSSLLEDSIGAAFSGKYKSLFLANQGEKEFRLQALMDAIAEVYSSTFGSDPIEYRTERGLIDFKEAMGIIIQEVVGKKIGKYFFPSYAGVAFSQNEFRWSPRIKRDDGLIRIVPGLGTRAVDRLSDDFPVLVAPGQPGLRVNATPEEVIRYAPKFMDVINLESNSFETVAITDIFKNHGDEIPATMQMISVVRDKQIRQPSLLDTDFEEDDILVTFENLISKSTFIKQIKLILEILQENMKTSIDIEFASDGDNFHLLQCRPQGLSPDSAPAQIPRDAPEEAIVFTANKYISNGFIPDITHIVYVNSQAYSDLTDLKALMRVGRAVGKLNALLPKRQFILMGPGRWGSRGDIKLGVNVTYSDINNTSVLIEIARQKGNYVPDLSFGTHFFQDLTEASIKYIPLYPDDPSAIFNEDFLLDSENVLKTIIPEFGDLENVIHVIDVSGVREGKVLRIFMNAEQEMAMGVLAEPSNIQEDVSKEVQLPYQQKTDEHWRWRLRMAEKIAQNADATKFGVESFYVFGSAKNGTARADSDVNIMLHFNGTDEQKCMMESWLEGWSICLSEINFLRTGYKSEGLLDVHFVSDEDIAQKRGVALKIGAVTDAARKLRMKNN